MPSGALSPVVGIIFRDFVNESFVHTIDTLRDDFAELLEKLADHFPNPWRMGDDLFAFGSSITGRILTAPFAGMEGWLIRMVVAAGYANRVMTVKGCIKLVIRSFSEVVTNLTGTSSSSLVGALATSAGRWVWATYKRFAFLRAVISWTTEEQVIAYFRTKLIGRATTVGVALFVIAVFSSLAWTGAIAVLIGFGLSILSGEFEKNLLPQDSQRKWRKKGAVHRVNRRRGPDVHP